MNKYIRKSDKLRNECIIALSDKFFETGKSKYCSHPAFQLQEGRCDNYDEIVYMQGEWELYDHQGYTHSIYTLPLQTLCEMVDEILTTIDK